MTKRKTNQTAGRKTGNTGSKGRSLATRATPDVIDQTNEAEPSGEPATSKPSGLYLVATPIGNSRDITLRALDILAGAHVIACEDTRVTAKLLAIHNISRPLLAYHEHNADKAGADIIKRLKNGEIVALVSDAGTPMISDPGYRLVRACAEEGLMVTHLPGASSVLTGLVLSGLPTDRFMYAGFPPVKSAKRRSFFDDLKSVPSTLVFLESPKRLAVSLADMVTVLGNRDAAVGRELTKMFEEVRRGSLGELAAHYAEAGAPKGEVTVIVGPPGEAPALTDEDLDRMIEEALQSDTLRDACARVAAATGIPRRDIYSRALRLAEKT